VEMQDRSMCRELFENFMLRARWWFMSAQRCDSNGENAGVTDGLFAIADAVNNLAEAIQVHAAEVQRIGSKV